MYCLQMLNVKILLFVLIHYSLSEEFYDHLKLPDRRFVPLWNSPTEQCKTKWNITIDLAKYGIVANHDQKWNGEHMNIFYESYGLWPIFNDKNEPVNGGLPQLGNLTAHLTKMEKDIKEVLPDKDYQGMAVIDFESWRPMYKRLWVKLEIYRNKSEELVRKEHPKWCATNISREAQRQFESAAKDYMLQTLELGRKLRPKALWGYYGFPRCYNRKSNSSECAEFPKELNDELMWLFNASTVILPSIYLNQKPSKTDSFDYVKGNILEAMRVGNQTDDGPLPVFAYVRLVYTFSDIFLNKTDMYATVTQSAELGTSGIIIWGASADQTEDFCQNLKIYIDSFFGQLIERLTSIAEDCSKQYCSSHGRCRFKMSHLKQFEMSDFLDISKQWRFLRCNCDRGWEGKDCSSEAKYDDNEMNIYIL